MCARACVITIILYIILSISQVAGPKSGSKFYEGNTVVTYKATDTDGETDFCAVTITVKGENHSRMVSVYCLH